MKTEKILAFIFLIGLIFKFMNWAGHGIILVTSLPLLTLLYFPGAFYFFCDKIIKRQNLALSILSGFFFSFIPIGILFKLMYWPGGQLPLLVGAISAMILLAVVYSLKSKAVTELAVYYRNMLLRTVVLTLLASFFYIVPTATLLKIQYSFDPELARLKELYYTHPTNEEYRRAHDAYLIKNNYNQFQDVDDSQ